MATPKYNGAIDPIDGRPLHWNVHPGGLPIRQGDSPRLIDKHQLAAATSVRFFRSRIFKIPEDNEAYMQVMDWIANGLADLYKRQVREVPNEADKWTVWLEWIDVRGVIPNSDRMDSQ